MSVVRKVDSNQSKVRHSQASQEEQRAAMVETSSINEDPRGCSLDQNNQGL